MSTVSAAEIPSSMSTRKPERKGDNSVLFYLLPISALMGVVYVLPLFFTFWISLHETSYYQVGALSGLDSFTRLFSDLSLVGETLTTIVYSLGTLIIALPLGLAAALLLEKIVLLKRLARSVLLLPWLMSQATAGAIWMWFLNPSYGSASYLTTQAGLGPLAVFAQPESALIALVLITAWWSYPQAMILFIGALQTIPRELFESLEVDGGGKWQSLRYVILPHLRNTIVSVIVVLLMLYAQMVTIILVTTRGGPLDATNTLSMSVYNKMFVDYDLSGAAATAILLFAINIALTLIAIRFRRKDI